MGIGFILLLVLAGLVGWLIMTYNGLIKSKNQVEEAWSDTEVQFKRRYDLIPNLVSTVRGYASHEQGIYDKITEARTQAMSANTAAEKSAAEGMLSGALRGLFALAESNPELKANQNFLELQREISDTEDKIQASWRFYNGNVRDFNTKLEVFPTNMIATSLGFKKRDLFDVDDKVKETPKVEF